MYFHCDFELVGISSKCFMHNQNWVYSFIHFVCCRSRWVCRPWHATLCSRKGSLEKSSLWRQCLLCKYELDNKNVLCCYFCKGLFLHFVFFEMCRKIERKIQFDKQYLFSLQYIHHRVCRINNLDNFCKIFTVKKQTNRQTNSQKNVYSYMLKTFSSGAVGKIFEIIFGAFKHLNLFSFFFLFFFFFSSSSLVVYYPHAICTILKYICIPDC